MTPVGGDFTRGMGMEDFQEGGVGDPVAESVDIDINTPDPDEIDDFLGSVVDRRKAIEEGMQQDTEEFLNRMSTMMDENFSNMSASMSQTFEEMTEKMSNLMQNTNREVVESANNSMASMDAKREEIEERIKQTTGEAPPDEYIDEIMARRSGATVPGEVADRIGAGEATDEEGMMASMMSVRDETAADTGENILGDQSITDIIGENEGLNDLLTGAGITLGGRLSAPDQQGALGKAGQAGGTAGREFMSGIGLGRLSGLAKIGGPAAIGTILGTGAVMAAQDTWEYNERIFERERQTGLDESTLEQLSRSAVQLDTSFNLTEQEMRDLSDKVANLNIATDDMGQAMGASSMTMNNFGLNAQQASELTETYIENGWGVAAMMGDLSQQAAIANMAGVSRQETISTQQQVFGQMTDAYGYQGGGGATGAQLGMISAFGPESEAHIPGFTPEDAAATIASTADPTVLLQRASLAGMSHEQANRAITDPEVQGRMHLRNYATAARIVGQAPTRTDRAIQAANIGPTYGVDPGVLQSMIDKHVEEGMTPDEAAEAAISEQRAGFQEAREAPFRMQEIEGRVGGSARNILDLFSDPIKTFTGATGLSPAAEERMDPGRIRSQLEDIDRAFAGEGLPDFMQGMAVASAGEMESGNLDQARLRFEGIDKDVNLEMIQEFGKQIGGDTSLEDALRLSGMGEELGEKNARRLFKLMKDPKWTEKIEAAVYGEGEDQVVQSRKDLEFPGMGPDFSSDTPSTSVQGQVGGQQFTIGFQGDAAKMFTIMSARGVSDLEDEGRDLSEISNLLNE